MKGWILHLPWDDKPEDPYSIVRFREEAQKDGIELDVFRPEVFDLMVTREDRKSILVEGDAKELPTFLMPRMGAQTTYFSLAVIRHLERLGVHTVNSSVAIDTVKDKLYSQQILAENNLPVPRTILVKFPINADMVEKYLGFPVIIKTIYGAQGKGVFLADDRNQFLDMMQLIEVTNNKANIILQEYIEESRGRDLRVVTIGGRSVACMQRIANEGFKANFSQGGRVEPFQMTPEIEYLASSASRLMGLDIAGVDLLFDREGRFKVCEVNSAPGFKGLEEACEINIPKEIFHYIRIRLGQIRR